MSKSGDRNKPTDLTEHAIAQRASELSRKIQPAYDLWPQICNSIKELPQEDYFPNNIANNRNNWMPMALAASLFIAVFSLGLTGYTVYSSDQSDMTSLTEISAVELIDKPYLVARASYLTVLAVDEKTMSPGVRAVLRKNLKIIDEATDEIRGALKLNPNDQYLTEALIMTHKKEIELLNQVAGYMHDAI